VVNGWTEDVATPKLEAPAQGTSSRFVLSPLRFGTIRRWSATPIEVLRSFICRGTSSSAIGERRSAGFGEWRACDAATGAPQRSLLYSCDILSAYAVHLIQLATLDQTGMFPDLPAALRLAASRTRPVR
jgi:hypothetical protein